MIPKALMSGKILQLTNSSPSHTGSRIENTRTEEDESSGHSRENEGFLGNIPGAKRGEAALQNRHSPRTMQFLVERNCEILWRMFPNEELVPITEQLVTWVDPIPRPEKSECGGVCWTVVPEEARRIRAAAGFSEPAGEKFICEHMGHLIE